MRMSSGRAPTASTAAAAPAFIWLARPRISRPQRTTRAPAASARRAVSSREPPSATTTAAGGGTCARNAATVAPIDAASSSAGMTASTRGDARAPALAPARRPRADRCTRACLPPPPPAARHWSCAPSPHPPISARLVDPTTTCSTVRSRHHCRRSAAGRRSPCGGARELPAPPLRACAPERHRPAPPAACTPPLGAAPPAVWRACARARAHLRPRTPTWRPYSSDSMSPWNP